MPRIKQMALVALFCVLCVMLISRGRAQQAAPPQPQPAESKATAAWISQLVATAEDGRKQALAQYRAGLGTSEDVHTWTMRLIDARLMAAKDKKSRVEVLTVRVAMAEQFERDATGRQNAGLTRPLDLVDAHYGRIQAEIDLANEQVK